MPGPEAEILEGGRPSGRPGRGAAIVVALLAVVGLVLWAGDGLRAPEERRALSRCAGEAGHAVERAEERLAAMASYIAPGLGTVSSSRDASLLAMIEEQAAGLDGPVEAALRTCRDVELWPVSGTRREARAAYVALLKAERDRLRRISHDGSAFFTGYDEVKVLAEEAAARLAE